MIELLIVADDFTGALDTGVQFACEGIKTRVIADSNWNGKVKDTETKVLVIDAETRHLPKQEAYDVVYGIVAAAKKQGIPFLYKKTDSALRGNIGSELTALMDASDERVLSFIPAFPKMNRITKKGIHYIEDIPVHESVFGQDPFEPVVYSSVKEIIKMQSTINTLEIREVEENRPLLKEKPEEGIYIYDGETEEDLQKIADHLKNRCNVMAGCAGFASLLPQLLNLEKEEPQRPTVYPNLLVVCGSVNPITKKQLAYGQKHGFTRIYLQPEHKLEKEYWSTAEGEGHLQVLAESLKKSNYLIVDANDEDESDATKQYIQRQGLELEQVRVSISETLGVILQGLLQRNIESTLLVTGGDTLVGFMKAIGVEELTPICELTAGCVLTEFEYEGRKYPLISKSGGFGSEKLLEELTRLLEKRSVETC